MPRSSRSPTAPRRTPVGGQRFKIYYATQTSNRPFRLKLFCNQERNLTESYRRYLNRASSGNSASMAGPIHFDLIGRKRCPSSTPQPTASPPGAGLVTPERIE